MICWGISGSSELQYYILVINGTLATDKKGMANLLVCHPVCEVNDLQHLELQQGL